MPLFGIVTLRRNCIRYLLLFGLGLGLWWGSASWAVPSVAQIPSLPSTTMRDLVNSPVRSLPTAGQIGNLVYAPVSLDGLPVFNVAMAESQESEKNNNPNNLTPLEQRVRRIQNNLQEILKRGFEPQSLQVYPAVLNGQTVIRVSDGANGKPQTVGTITEYDSQLYGARVEEVAADAAKAVREALLRAKSERQVDYLRQQSLWAAVILGMILGLTLVFLLLQRWLTGQIHELKKALADVIDNLQKHPPATPDPNPPLVSSASTLTRLLAEIGDRLAFLGYLVGRQINTWLKKPRFPIPARYTFITDSLANFFINPHQYTDAENIKNFCRKRIYFLIFLRRILTLYVLFIWVRGIALILSLFPYSRELGLQLAGTPIALLIIWLSMMIVIKIGAFVIDEILHAWEEDIKLIERSNSRKALRIPTISNALKSTFTVFAFSIGIILTLGIFNVPIATVLAGAGILGFAISFGSQSLIKDLIAGIINLFNDGYAVGDFVTMEQDEGLVEDMNLFVTRLRNSHGNLITIPNGSIQRVCNQTKDWSQVDYSVQVAYDADIEQALEIIQTVAEKLCHDPQWRSLILDKPDVKGVEDLSYQGVRLRIWLKTKPGEQWPVARELRLRLKTALEQAGVSIGIPKQAFLLQNTEESSSNR